MKISGKSYSKGDTEGKRKVQNGKEVPTRSTRKKDYSFVFPKPHDLDGNLIRR